jgi:hypothetical protein
MPSFGGPPRTADVVVAATVDVAPGAAPAGTRGGMVEPEAAAEPRAGVAAAVADVAGAADGTGDAGAADAVAIAGATGAGSTGSVVPHWTQNRAPGCVS